MFMVRKCYECSHCVSVEAYTCDVAGKLVERYTILCVHIVRYFSSQKGT